MDRSTKAAIENLVHPHPPLKLTKVKIYSDLQIDDHVSSSSFGWLQQWKRAMLNANLNDLELGYADYVNYLVGKVVPPKWTSERRKSCDYVSKWVEAQALPTNDARVVVKFLRGLFARFEVPKNAGLSICPQDQDILNEALLTTLERHFPSFKFLSPSQIVDNQGYVKDIDNSPGNGKGNALSEPPRSLKRIV
ncbi:hypothetical protein Tco_0018033 [Tanacetum coccineum]